MKQGIFNVHNVAEIVYTSALTHPSQLHTNGQPATMQTHVDGMADLNN